MEYKLKNVFWDYNFTDEDLNNLLYGKIHKLGDITRADLLTRMIEYLNWFDIVKFIDYDIFIANFTVDFIKSLKEPDLRKGLLFAREFLLRESISASR